MPWWDAKKIKDARVLMIGAGALGNEVLKNLTLLGVGNIIVVDMDTIDYTNLSRSILFRPKDCGAKKNEVAAAAMREINPNVKVMTLDADITFELGLGFYRHVDVVVGGLDNRLARLAINKACYKVDKTWIDGGIQDLGGQAHVYQPGLTCYECGLTARDLEFIEGRLSCLTVAQQHAEMGTMATTPISASIVGAIQAQEAMKVIFGEAERNRMIKEDFYYEGKSNVVLQRGYPRLKDYCTSHTTYGKIIDSPLSASTTVQEVLSWVGKHFGDANPGIELDELLVSEFVTEKSHIRTKLLLPKAKMDNRFIARYRQVPGEGLVITKSYTSIGAEHPELATATLAECGVPAFHIIRILTEEGEKYVELSGDAHLIDFK